MFLLLLPALSANPRPGKAQSPRLLKDLNTIPRSNPTSFPEGFFQKNDKAWKTWENYRFARLGPVVFFSADDGVHGAEMWRTGGTVSGTFMLKDFNPGKPGSVGLYSCPNVDIPVAAGGKIFWAA